MTTKEKIAAYAALLAVPMSAHAETASGGGVLFALGFGTGLGTGLLICWWRCRKHRKDDRPVQ
ncbi:MAG TPA: hypothetical protein VF169_27815 [Albitalea sp.]|uniref:hypothetical protein n=1 Tax=Piscinibacter sp. TaxID=1903157 RepID=UPI002ED05F8F